MNRPTAATRLDLTTALASTIAVISLLLTGCNDAVVDPAHADVPKPIASDDSKSAPTESRKQPEEQDTDENTEAKESESDAADATGEEESAMVHPFTHRIPAPSLDGGLGWINTAGPLDLEDLEGKFVLLDFWTYCCINCMHILPELKQLEHAYPNELVVIGVHSAKFETEKESDNIREAVLRHEIEHPVVNDANHAIWNRFGIRSWPSLLLIDPEGNAVRLWRGETKFEDFDAELKRALPYYRKKGVLDTTPLKFDLAAAQARKTPLRFPGKVLADEASSRLFISDSNHNRIVIADLEGKLLDTIGTGEIGSDDGGYDECSFDHPQGMAIDGETLYVSDTENHMLRKVDLAAKKVTTIAGTGEQGFGWPGIDKVRVNPLGEIVNPPDDWLGPPKTTELNSPWALWVHEGQLYIAMAGPHQIWRMALDGSAIGPYAGNGIEDIVDGLLLPDVPYQKAKRPDPNANAENDEDDEKEEAPTPYSSFAQPSGLASDGKWLYVADSEGSSVRAVPFSDGEEVWTVVGSAHLPFNRLFTFGDVDGEGEEVRLQHVLGVAHYQGRLYLADTYNNKIKVLDPETGRCETIAGTGKPGLADEPSQFDEPAGVSVAAGKLYIADTNNHAIRVIDLDDDYRVSTLMIEGLAPPKDPKPKFAKVDFATAPQVNLNAVTVRPEGGKVNFDVKLRLPLGWKLNKLAQQRWLYRVEGENSPLDAREAGKWNTTDPATSFTASVPVAADKGEANVKIGLEFFYCQEGNEGLCRMGRVQWTVPLTLSQEAKGNSVPLSYRVE